MFGKDFRAYPRSNSISGVFPDTSDRMPAMPRDSGLTWGSAPGLTREHDTGAGLGERSSTSIGPDAMSGARRLRQHRSRRGHVVATASSAATTRCFSAFVRTTFDLVCAATRTRGADLHRPVRRSARRTRHRPGTAGRVRRGRRVPICLSPGRGDRRRAVPVRRSDLGSETDRTGRFPCRPGPARRGAPVDDGGLLPSGRPRARPAGEHDAAAGRRCPLSLVRPDPSRRTRRLRGDDHGQPHRRAVHRSRRGTRSRTVARRRPAHPLRLGPRLPGLLPVRLRPGLLDGARRRPRGRLVAGHPHRPARPGLVVVEHPVARRPGDCPDRRRRGRRIVVHRRGGRRVRVLPGADDRHRRCGGEPAGLRPHHRLGPALGRHARQHRTAAPAHRPGRHPHRAGAARSAGTDRGAAPPAVQHRGHPPGIRHHRPARLRRSHHQRDALPAGDRARRPARRIPHHDVRTDRGPARQHLPKWHSSYDFHRFPG